MPWEKYTQLDWALLLTVPPCRDPLSFLPPPRLLVTIIPNLSSVLLFHLRLLMYFLPQTSTLTPQSPLKMSDNGFTLIK